jgi:protein phosphatase
MKSSPRAAGRADVDGLWRLVDDARLAAILGAHPDPDAACAALIDAANAAGGFDNATAVVVAL